MGYVAQYTSGHVMRLNSCDYLSLSSLVPISQCSICEDGEPCTQAFWAVQSKRRCNIPLLVFHPRLVCYVWWIVSWKHSLGYFCSAVLG